MKPARPLPHSWHGQNDMPIQVSKVFKLQQAAATRTMAIHMELSDMNLESESIIVSVSDAFLSNSSATVAALISILIPEIAIDCFLISNDSASYTTQ